MLKSDNKKIINDPIYGFISFPFGIHYEIIEHPYFQRLRRINQLGLTNYVYPGANHTRFQHALGCGHLMWQAIQVLRSKEIEISDHEAESVISAMLLHDIGHGPFSHSLENSIISGTDHEKLSLIFMNTLNEIFEGRLSLAIQIFKNEYHKRFLFQLVSGQLDMDRLDYLKRDSYFTGVTEGVIGSDRIIKMLNVADDELVVDSKGIYSVEKFLVARRLMYWQVYLHKTVLAAEHLLINTLKRAKELSDSGEKLFATEALSYFLTKKEFDKNLSQETLTFFSLLDDGDILISAKSWMKHKDPILSRLAGWLINRKLFAIRLQNNDFPLAEKDKIKEAIINHYGISESEVKYLMPTGDICNMAYNSSDEKIRILQKNGSLKEIISSSDIFDLSALSKTVKKYYLCFPKELKKKGIIT
ncbi:MAG: HD domain-containing protein [Bacteroidales bacterium]|nr:HD domain-containing protein [Bacteroidales bacterium]MCF8390654.1 HD domain-containing protein [Bacteroidales bacterium]